MRKITAVAAIVSSLAFLNACKNGDSNESSQSSAASGGGLDFNLGEHLWKSGVRFPSKYVFVTANGLSVGSASNFLLENNLTIKSQNQKISAECYTDATVLRKKIPGHAIDLTASASTGKLEAEVNFRILGQSLYSVKKSSVITQNFTRDIGTTIPYPILPILTIDLGGSVGGEVGFTIAPGLGSDNRSVQLSFEPDADLHGKVAAGVSVLFAKAEAQGTIKLIEAKMPVVSSLGAPTQVKIDPLTINLLAGKADLVASLDLGNVLPDAAAKIWNKVAGDGLKYTYPLISYDGIPKIVTAGHTYAY